VTEDRSEPSPPRLSRKSLSQSLRVESYNITRREVRGRIGENPRQRPSTLGGEALDLPTGPTRPGERGFEGPNTERVAPTEPPVRVKLDTSGIDPDAVAFQAPPPTALRRLPLSTHRALGDPCRRQTRRLAPRQGDSRTTRVFYRCAEARSSLNFCRPYNRGRDVHSGPLGTTRLEISVIGPRGLP